MKQRRCVLDAPERLGAAVAGLALARTRRDAWAAVKATLRQQSGRYSLRFRFYLVILCLHAIAYRRIVQRDLLVGRDRRLAMFAC
jgi:hypothetical protein